MAGYDGGSRVFHWLTVLLVLVMVPVGFLMTQEIGRPLQDRLFILHKGLGPIVLVIVLLRILWRLAHPAPPLPDSMPLLQRRLATVVHLGLYAALIVMAVSGYVRVIAGGFPIELLNALGVPPLLAKDEALAAAAKSVHATTAVMLVGLVTLHVGAALHHGLVQRDGVLARMWPPFGARVTRS